ncbi:hypothetical protein TbgDal_XI410 [Trypanosoma brucei gambiense DAL972]|uniref:Uncharacterized protein n=1 Tax=Trypanosoma brucei gambiense (strain MHOM/CI/86/DAL972) TaxID=679716 RepID=D0A5H5_TRYB9|nr:hypothetical protein TbgDal_XI410 [Trypanosoma brucei gambiense DAL972]CBH16926.1 hypothetical protein TbgDal_XI410 [Trypanosoma brucei gambiense DAL972]|eukprot:XP_011779190.1 hypothetical protein TbgDal_XI410 [Trypanosoma brucei gambiense DAL972]
MPPPFPYSSLLGTAAPFLFLSASVRKRCLLTSFFVFIWYKFVFVFLFFCVHHERTFLLFVCCFVLSKSHYMWLKQISFTFCFVCVFAFLFSLSMFYFFFFLIHNTSEWLELLKSAISCPLFVHSFHFISLYSLAFIFLRAYFLAIISCVVCWANLGGQFLVVFVFVFSTFFFCSFVCLFVLVVVVHMLFLLFSPPSYFHMWVSFVPVDRCCLLSLFPFSLFSFFLFFSFSFLLLLCTILPIPPFRKVLASSRLNFLSFFVLFFFFNVLLCLEVSLIFSLTVCVCV